MNNFDDLKTGDTVWVSDGDSSSYGTEFTVRVFTDHEPFFYNAAQGTFNFLPEQLSLGELTVEAGPAYTEATRYEPSKTFWVSHENCDGHDVWDIWEECDRWVATQSSETGKPWRRFVMDGGNNVSCFSWVEEARTWKLDVRVPSSVTFDFVPFMLLIHRTSGRLLGKATVMEAKPEVLYG